MRDGLTEKGSKKRLRRSGVLDNADIAICLPITQNARFYYPDDAKLAWEAKCLIMDLFVAAVCLLRCRDTRHAMVGCAFL